MVDQDYVYIDGDILPYRVGFATQHTVYYCESEGQHSGLRWITRSKAVVNKLLKVEPTALVSELFFVESEFQAVMTLKLMIQSIVQGSGRKAFKVIMSGEDNFRTNIATIQPYKGNRVGTEKPVHWQMLRDWLLDKPYTIVSDNEEADDVLSRACLRGCTIATIDKDLDNTPGLHYNFVKKTKYYVDPKEAMKNFYRQMLVGDKADHIPGIKGIGPVKADRILDDCRDEVDYERAIKPHYYKTYGAYGWKNAMTEVGQLLWMRREEGEMWLPSILGGEMYKRGKQWQ